MASQAKKRKMNFSEREVEIIVEEMEKQKHILVNHYNAGVTHIAKNNAWMDILKRVNAVTNCQRELAEVKKKWSDLKTEVRRKVAQARAAIEDTGDCTTVPVILTAMQQRICNLLGEATIISLPAGESGEPSAEIAVPVSVPISTATTTVTLTQSIQPTPGTTCEMKTLEVAETTFHTLEEGMVEYCTTETPVTVTTEAPVEVLAAQAECSVKPQELKSRIALNSAKLLQEQRVTNLHVREIAQHLENQNDLLQMIRRSQEAQACAQERQAQALEGTQATLLALIQMFKPALKDLRKFLQNANNPNVTGGIDTGEGVVNMPQQVEDGQ
ncbi:nuclear apoptosis-inducing factor 1 isoform X2 [Ictalurus furcatus]|uniref:nuclear apoptosis-inducing factor 1 isoform X2 n=1 Tax=Ictalurus furcatus TaxID=66913 RepID=UPI00234FD95D|nr:nuclear apoptosis-inducing factor 1 isoform X2 [Ictalurus furcatus]